MDHDGDIAGKDQVGQGRENEGVLVRVVLPLGQDACDQDLGEHGRLQLFEQLLNFETDVFKRTDGGDQLEADHIFLPVRAGFSEQVAQHFLHVQHLVRRNILRPAGVEAVGGPWAVFVLLLVGL